MRSNQLKRFLNSDVVGQLKNGLFFEGHVVDNAGRPSVIDRDSRGTHQISAPRVRWLTKAVRYC
ncbi:MAG TPA: hypothetical protein VNA15_03930 [Candidatus Angelobacter sp.]|nr:hypothetical protein [Candidatus Angelobacter sp.]